MVSRQIQFGVISSSFLVLFFFGILLAGAQNASAQVRVGFIDIQKSVAETKEFKRAFNSFRAKFQKERQIITEREKKIKDMLDELNKKGFVLSPELKKRKEENFLKEKKEFERYVQDKNEEFGRQEKEITDKIVRKMLKVLKTLGKERKYTMILEKKSVFYSDTAGDLTKMATLAYDKVHK